MNGAIHAMACRHATNPTGQIIAEIRDRIGVWRPLPSVTYRDAAVDYLVHAQDIAIPLGRHLDMRADAAVVAANRVSTSDRMFHAGKKLARYRHLATDTTWSAGQGRKCPAYRPLLLLLTRRPPALAWLSGAGAAALAEAPAVRGSAVRTARAVQSQDWCWLSADPGGLAPLRICAT